MQGTFELHGWNTEIEIQSMVLLYLFPSHASELIGIMLLRKLKIYAIKETTRKGEKRKFEFCSATDVASVKR